jgi:hypothetical protein
LLTGRFSCLASDFGLLARNLCLLTCIRGDLSGR